MSLESYFNCLLVINIIEAYFKVISRFYFLYIILDSLFNLKNFDSQKLNFQIIYYYPLLFNFLFNQNLSHYIIKINYLPNLITNIN
jgi:hypothetical protein